ncbi:MAG: histidine phosphatase family protein [Actinomycetota bacterium]|nr:histidine phosphatase family protein [Actinomycetota bacterium]
MNGTTATTVHLVRHGQVENPRGIIYGRLPGFHLSEVGTRQAEASATRLAETDVALVWASPLERAQETARLIALWHAIDVVTDERLTESRTTLEGAAQNLTSFLRSPRSWISFRNPLSPSWGESFAEIRTRMVQSIHDAVEAAGGRDVVLVSHQTPVLVARLALAGRRVPPWLAFTPCETGSITSLELLGGRLLSAAYFAPPA